MYQARTTRQTNEHKLYPVQKDGFHLGSAYSFPAGTRTRNPLIRSQMPYPLGHGEPTLWVQHASITYLIACVNLSSE